MDVRRILNTRIWADTWFENITAINKLVWIYLLTNQNTNMLGIYELSSKRASFELRITKNKFDEIIKKIEEDKKCFRINNYIFIPNWIKNQSMNPNMIKSAKTSFSNLPQNVLDWLSNNKIDNFDSLITLSKGFSNALQSLSKIERKEKEESESKSHSKFIKPTKQEKVKKETLPHFEKWLEYRKSIKKPITNKSTLELLVKRFNLEPIEKIEWIINHSIENNYQGLFWDKYKKDSPIKKNPIIVGYQYDCYHCGKSYKFEKSGTYRCTENGCQIEMKGKEIVGAKLDLIKTLNKK